MSYLEYIVRFSRSKYMYNGAYTYTYTYTVGMLGSCFESEFKKVFPSKMHLLENINIKIESDGVFSWLAFEDSFVNKLKQLLEQYGDLL